MTYRDRVLRHVTLNPGCSAAQIWQAMGWFDKYFNLANSLYPTLYALERDNEIFGQWVEGPYPRRRIYYQQEPRWDD